MPLPENRLSRECHFVFGCWDSTACNYNPTANYNSGICLQPLDACDDGNPQTVNDLYDENCLCAGNVLGMEEEVKNSLLNVYPKPAHDVLNINFSNVNDLSNTWQIWNVCGQLIQQGSIMSSGVLTIPVENYPSGIYSFQWSSKSGVEKMTFVITH